MNPRLAGTSGRGAPATSIAIVPSRKSLPVRTAIMVVSAASWPGSVSSRIACLPRYSTASARHLTSWRPDARSSESRCTAPLVVALAAWENDTRIETRAKLASNGHDADRTMVMTPPKFRAQFEGARDPARIGTHGENAQLSSLWFRLRARNPTATNATGVKTSVGGGLIL